MSEAVQSFVYGIELMSTDVIGGIKLVAPQALAVVGLVLLYWRGYKFFRYMSKGY